MTWAAVAIGGASLISGVIGANAAGSAASQQAAAAQNAQNIGLQEFNTITGQQQPFMNAGYGALGQLNYLLGQGTPGTGGARGTACLEFCRWLWFFAFSLYRADDGRVQSCV